MACHNLQSWTKRFKQSLVFIWNSTPWEKFDFYFPAAFWWY